MKPQRYIRHLESGAVSPAQAAEVRRFASALIEKHGTAGVAELAAEGKLAEVLPFSANLPKYDPQKARRRPIPAKSPTPRDDLVEGLVAHAHESSIYEEVSVSANLKHVRAIHSSPVVELTGVKIYAVGRRWVVVEMSGEKALLKLAGNKSLLESALGGANAHTKILGQARRKVVTKSITNTIIKATTKANAK